MKTTQSVTPTLERKNINISWHYCWYKN